MGPETRLYGWDLVALALFADAPDPATVTGAPLYDLIAIFTDFKLRIEDKSDDGRATSGLWDVPLPICSGWSVEIASVVDATTTTMTWNRIQNGFGPFWIQITNADGTGLHGRVKFDSHELRAPIGAQSENTLLKGIDELLPGFLGTVLE